MASRAKCIAMTQVQIDGFKCISKLKETPLGRAWKISVSCRCHCVRRG